MISSPVGCLSNSSPSLCRFTETGTAYNGTINTTKSGKTCQRWDSQTPHAHPYTSDVYFPDDNMSDLQNYCRNPDGSAEGVWCYTMDPSVERETCDVPRCGK